MTLKQVDECALLTWLSGSLWGRGTLKTRGYLSAKMEVRFSASVQLRYLPLFTMSLSLSKAIYVHFHNRHLVFLVLHIRMKYNKRSFDASCKLMAYCGSELAQTNKGHVLQISKAFSVHRLIFNPVTPRLFLKYNV